MINRRQFIQLSGAAACAAASPWSLLRATAADDAKKIPIGLQLYSVRTECAKDLTGTITAVAKMGYKGVEFAGYYGHTAKDLRKLLDDVGLKCCGTHTGIPTLRGDKLDETVAFNQEIGNKFLIVPGGIGGKTKEDWKKSADEFNEIAEKLKPHGMRVGYHNHSHEFKPLEGGELPWDVFFSNTKKDVVMQCDTGNAMHGGSAVVPFIKQYPGRTATIHIKPFSKAKPDALLGDDELPWKEIFEVCETIAATEWYIVEYENKACPPLEAVEKCLQAMKQMGKC